MLPLLTHQIDDMTGAGHMYAVGHQSLQDLPVCFYTVGSVVCNYSPDIIHIKVVAVEGGYYETMEKLHLSMKTTSTRKYWFSTPVKKEENKHISSYT